MALGTLPAVTEDWGEPGRALGHPQPPMAGSGSPQGWDWAAPAEPCLSMQGETWGIDTMAGEVQGCGSLN